VIPEIVHMLGEVGRINTLTHPYYMRQAMSGREEEDVS
jgi:hypothetical protein